MNFDRLIEHSVRQWRIGAIGAGSAALVGLCCLVFPLGKGLENLSYDLPFYYRPKVSIDEAVIVKMDLESHRKFGLSRFMPWPRSLHAQLLRRLKECGTKAVVFDVLFLPSTNNPTADAEFVQAAKAHGRVVVAAMLTPDVVEGRLIGWQPAKPFDALAAEVAWGMVEESGDSRAIRQHFMFDTNYVSLAWKTASLTMSNPPPSFACRWFNYYGPPGFMPSFSYYEALETNGLLAKNFAAAVSNKVVFVGALYHAGHAGGKGTDDYVTPFTRWTGTLAPGVEINATAYLNLLRGDWLRRASPATEFFLVLGLGLVFGYGLALARPGPAAGWGLLAALLVAVGAIWRVWHSLQWFPWLMVSGVQIPCAIAWSLVAQAARLAREKDLLEKQLALIRAGARPADTESRLPAPPSTPVPAPTHSPLGLGSAFWKAPPSAASETDPQAPTMHISPAARELGLQIPDHTLVRSIGRGAYGEVWLAQDVLGTFHAVKIVKRDRFEAAEPYEREFNGLKRFTPISRSHPGFLHILHVGRAENFFYYIMEVGDDEVTGQQVAPATYKTRNLRREIDRRKRLPLKECVELGLQLAAALDFLHQQKLIHRDIKPANIIFVNGRPKFADIGLVTQVATDDGEVSYVGTGPYIPPEGPGSPAGDIYALGKVIYETGLGMKAADFPALPSIMVEQSDQEDLYRLNTIILKACKNEARERYASAAALQTDLLLLKNQLR